MKIRNVPFFALFILSCTSTPPFLEEEKKVRGLSESVEILRDQWGINHIYANNQKDLFLLKGMRLHKIVCFNLNSGEDKPRVPLLKFWGLVN